MAYFYWFLYKEGRIEDISYSLNRLNLQINEINDLEKNFFLFETINPEFYRTGQSQFLKKYRTLVDTMETHLQSLKNTPELKETNIAPDIKLIINKMDAYEFLSDRLISAIRKRGFKDYGLIGDMRKLIHQVEEESDLYNLNASKILSIRRQEKDYIIRKEAVYIDNLNQAVMDLENEIKARIPDPDAQRKMLRILSLYQNKFADLVKAENEIGFQNKQGLKGQLTALSREMVQIIQQISDKVLHLAESSKTNIKTTFLLLFILFTFFNILLGYYVIHRLSRPIKRLSLSINQVTEDKFAEGTEIYQTYTRDEIGGISRDVSLMLRRVRERTQEVLTQKEEIAKAYENVKLLSALGRKITANLNAEDIIQEVHQNLQELMDAPTFTVGIYNENKKRIEYLDRSPAFEPPIFAHDYFHEKHKFSIQAFESQKEIHLANAFTLPDPIPKDAFLHDKKQIACSQIYLPLISNDEAIGVMVVQSPRPEAYSEYHITLLKNMAIYITIALNNAQIYQKLDEKNKKITDSIVYARRIQNAMLPKMEDMQAFLPDSFILFKPRDIVSGDFYWFANVDSPLPYHRAISDHVNPEKNRNSQLDHRLVIAAVDCTGHGVPGAFMSVLGNDLLNQIIRQKKVLEPDLILNKLHRGIQNSLLSNASENPDGMDMALCVINPREKMLEYAGAFNPLVYIQNNELNIIRANKKPVGVWYKENEDRTYTKHQIPIHCPTTFYMFSDGFADQTGGEYGKKFMSVHLHKLLLEIHQKPMEEQKHILNKTLKDWIGNRKQNDDVLIIGFHIQA